MRTAGHSRTSSTGRALRAEQARKDALKRAVSAETLKVLQREPAVRALPADVGEWLARLSDAAEKPREREALVHCVIGPNVRVALTDSDQADVLRAAADATIRFQQSIVANCRMQNATTPDEDTRENLETSQALLSTLMAAANAAVAATRAEKPASAA